MAASGTAPKKASRRPSPTSAARAVALCVLVGGMILVVLPLVEHGQHFARDPDAQRTVTSTAVESEFGGTGTKTVVRTPTGTTTTEVTESPAPKTKVTFSYGEEKRSLLEHAFGTGGFFLFRIALVLLAAFLAGAISQRALLGNFAIELPFLKFGDLKEAAGASEDAIEKLKQAVDDQHSVTERLAASVLETTKVIQKELGDLNDRVAKLEE